jgi:LPS export ABC transporter protein LptC
MGKKILTFSLFACFALAFYVYATRETKSLKENIAKASTQEPRIVMEDFVLHRYQGNRLIASLSAKLGNFYEPNLLELEGDVKGLKLGENGLRESVSAESAMVYLKATSLASLLRQQTEIDRIELTGFVEVGLKEHFLTTDYAEYVNADRSVRSLRPVRVEGLGRVFTGEEGFTYSLVSETLEMQGQVKGVVQIDEKK